MRMFHPYLKATITETYNDYILKNILFLSHPQTNKRLIKYVLKYYDTLSFQAIQRALKVFNINSKGVKTQISNLIDHQGLIIGIMDGTFVLIDNVETKFLSILDPNGWKKMNVSKFSERSADIFLLIDSNIAINCIKYLRSYLYNNKFLSLTFTSLSILLFVCIYYDTLQLLFALYFLGLLFSMLISFEDVFTNIYAMCNISERFNCEEANNSKFAKLFSVRVSALSTSYFIFCLNIITLYPAEIFILRFLAVITLMISLIYAFIQVFILDTFCLLCLFIIILNIAIFIITFHYWGLTFTELNQGHLLNLLLCLGISILLVLSIEFGRVFLKRITELSEGLVKYRKNFPFKLILEKSQTFHDNEINPFEIYLGNKNGSIIIDLCISPFCKTCMHDLRNADLLSQINSQVKVIIHLIPNNNRLSLLASEKLIYDRIKNGNASSVNLLRSYYRKGKLLAKGYHDIQVDLSYYTSLATKNKFKSVPIISINKKILPKEYRIDETFFFIINSL